MKTDRLWKLSVAIPAEAEEAVLDLLQQHFPGTPSVHLDLATAKTTVVLYLQKRADCSPAKLVALKAGLQVVRRCGLGSQLGQVRVSKLRPQDWAESWKNHFHPLAIGQRLLVKPTWIPHKPSRNQVVIELDPGLSFGTGHHPTTRFCLEEMVRHQPSQQPDSFLDVGTGSGILAIAAAKLGFKPVQAFDIDPVAVRIAKENAALNRVSGTVSLVRRDLRRWSCKRQGRQYNFICANLSEDLLLAYKTFLSNRLAIGGTLVLAGIPASQFSRVEKAYRKAGMILFRTRQRGQWRSGKFSFKALPVPS